MVTPGVYLNWSQGSAILVGKTNTIFQETEAVAGISFPGNETIPINVRMASSARDQQTFDTFTNVKLYLTGDSAQIATIQTVWPAQGGGLLISYDGGRTYKTFSITYGYELDPLTWILLPAQSIGLGGVDGILGPFGSANFVLKFVVPAQATQFQVYDIQLTADFDVA